ncbi:MAG: hypothetical protein KF773_14105 [Deltaproteobacteria bacterium]|nr:hypothetical protein [Deltaproteobacteria bacterium]
MTKANSTSSALENLLNILRSGKVLGSGAKGFIKGDRRAACFMDIPFASLKHVCTTSNDTRYEPFGIVVTKQTAYRNGARPVLYLSNDECDTLSIPKTELWRVVRFEVDAVSKKWKSFLHEREWRCPDDFKVPKRAVSVLVNSVKDVALLQAALAKGKFACQPQSILPLEVVCQGLVY